MPRYMGLLLYGVSSCPHLYKYSSFLMTFLRKGKLCILKFDMANNTLLILPATLTSRGGHRFGLVQIRAQTLQPSQPTGEEHRPYFQPVLSSIFRVPFNSGSVKRGFFFIEPIFGLV